jgi:hypothetical protein
VSVCFFSILVPLYCHEDDSRISDLVGIFSGLVVTVSSCRYVGDEVGTVSVLQYDEESNEIVTLPYCIPAHITLGKPSFDF